MWYFVALSYETTMSSSANILKYVFKCSKQKYLKCTKWPYTVLTTTTSDNELENTAHYIWGNVNMVFTLRI